MIIIEGKIVNGIKDGAVRELTAEEKLTVTSRASIGDDYVYYQGDEPQVELVPYVEPPNYYGLEQSLYNSSLFTKYLMDYNSKGLLFTTTIQNGKRGENVNEQTLLLGFQAMQIDFTQGEKDIINGILTANNFTIQLT